MPIFLNMGGKAPTTVADFDRIFRAAPVTPSPDSVGGTEIQDGSITTVKVAGAVAAANNTFHVKRLDELVFGAILDSDIPSAITRDTELTAATDAVTATAAGALSAHEAAADPHPGYVLESTVLNASATYDPPSLLTGATDTTTIACTGAALGDFALVSFSLDLQGVAVSAWVSSADTVSVRFVNQAVITQDLGSGTLKVRVWK